MGAWRAFLWSIVSTPRRFFWAMGVVFSLLILISPSILIGIVRRFSSAVGQALSEAIMQIIQSLNPLVYPAAVILVLFVGYRMVWRGTSGGRGR